MQIVEIEKPKKKRPIVFELTVKISSQISVIASLYFVNKFFSRNSAYFKSDLRGWGKTRAAPIPQTHIFYTLTFNHFNDGTRALFFHKPIFYCSLLDFSPFFFILQKNSKSWIANDK